MTRHTFDLVVLEVAGIGLAVLGLRLWATKELITNKGSGPLWEVAKLIKAVTA